MPPISQDEWIREIERQAEFNRAVLEKLDKLTESINAIQINMATGKGIMTGIGMVAGLVGAGLGILAHWFFQARH